MQTYDLDTICELLKIISDKNLFSVTQNFK